MRLFREYKKFLKDPVVEEFIDLFLFRPIAFLIVKVIYRLPVTPNQLSLVSMFSGIGSGICFAVGTQSSFLIAGILYGFTRVMDCSDGTLARMNNSGTLTGRIVDGTIDYVNGATVYAGLLIGLLKGGFVLPVSPLLLVIPAALFMGLHSMTIDYYRMAFLSYGLGKVNSPKADYEMFSTEFEKLKNQKGKSIDKFLIRIYLSYLKTQLKKIPADKNYDQQSYYQANKILLRLWTILGSSTYIFMIMISSVIGKPILFFFYSFFIANFCLIILLIIQIHTNKKLAK